MSTKEQRRANYLVTSAIRKGILPPQAECICANCGISRKDNPKVVIYYHHEDYDKPLEVISLCHECHRLRHLELDSSKFFSAGSRHTDETKRKISEALTGRTLSEEHKKKLSEVPSSWIGRKHSEETRRKMSEAAKNRKKGKD